MKKTGLLILITGMFFCGFAMADPGVPPVNEVQGLSIETTVSRQQLIRRHVTSAVLLVSRERYATARPIISRL
jgi:hypothetical protein